MQPDGVSAIVTFREARFRQQALDKGKKLKWQKHALEFEAVPDPAPKKGIFPHNL